MPETLDFLLKVIAPNGVLANFQRTIGGDPEEHSVVQNHVFEDYMVFQRVPTTGSRQLVGEPLVLNVLIEHLRQ